MTACPICSTEATAKREVYWTCPGCGVWFQSPMPTKRWHGAHEHWLGKPMGDDEKRANEQLATYLFETVLGGKASAVADIGCSYPYLLKCLENRGCACVGLDGEPRENDLGIDVIEFDMDQERIDLTYDLIIFVHTFEHIYDPLRAFRILRQMVNKQGTASEGVMFIRMPDNQVSGIERDLFDTMYEIHPFVHSLSSIAQLCAMTDTFVIESTYELVPGQRDMVLRPIV